MTRSLTVVSSNIRYDEPDDDVHAWVNRRDFLASRLLEYSPDLLATQEGKAPQIQDIDDRLAGLQRVDSHRTWVDALMYPCLFFNPDQLTLRSSGDIWLSESPSTPGSCSFGSAFPRLCTWASFAEGILAINVHLDNSNSETRICQIKVLMREIASLGNRGCTRILMGDFNEPPDSAVRDCIQTEWPELYDPWQKLGLAEESSHHNFYEPIDYGSRVDWILTSDDLEVEEILLDKSRSAQGIYPSDHYILKSRFTWPDTR